MLIRIEHKLGIAAATGAGSDSIFKRGDVVDWSCDADCKELIRRGYASAITDIEQAKYVTKTHAPPNGFSGHWRAL